MRKRFHNAGLTIPELMVVMFIMGILTTVLVAFYSESELILSRGITQTTLQQSARLASIRIIPKITSAVPNNSVSPPVPAIISPAAPPNEDTPATEVRELVLNSTQNYVEGQLRTSVSNFNPRTPTYREYRIWFQLDASKDQTNEQEAPGGRIGDLWIDGNTPDSAADDIKLASNLYDVTFKHETDNVVELTVTTKGYMRRAIGGRTLDEQVYSTRVHLPIYTHTPGGT